MAAGGFAAAGGWAVWAVGRAVADRRPGTAGLIGLLVAVVVLLGLAGAAGWVAWRLWSRWTAGTVRVVVGGSVAVAAYAGAARLMHVSSRWLGPDGRGLVLEAALLAGLVGGAVVYRRTTRAIVRSAGLDDPSADDRHGPTPGHAARVAAFCWLLGLQVWMTATAVGQAVGWAGHDPPWANGVAVFGPLVLGWATARVVRRRLLPPARPALPPGGFAVIVASDSQSEA